MWGSDWPVLNEAGDYAMWLEAAEVVTSRLSSSERDRIFGGTATEFYGLEP
jgi:L-fuconolactonase